MSIVDWPVWVADRIIGSSVTDLISEDNIFGSGGVRENPSTPFLVIRFGAELPATIPGVSNQDCTLWVHDKPLNYRLIRQVQQDLRGLFHDSFDNTVGLVRVTWQGDSVDLTDPGYNTFVRNTSIRLIGRSQ